MATAVNRQRFANLLGSDYVHQDEKELPFSPTAGQPRLLHSVLSPPPKTVIHNPAAAHDALGTLDVSEIRFSPNKTTMSSLAVSMDLLSLSPTSVVHTSRTELEFLDLDHIRSCDSIAQLLKIQTLLQNEQCPSLLRATQERLDFLRVNTSALVRNDCTTTTSTVFYDPLPLEHASQQTEENECSSLIMSLSSDESGYEALEQSNWLSTSRVIRFDDPGEDEPSAADFQTDPNIQVQELLEDVEALRQQNQLLHTQIQQETRARRQSRTEHQQLETQWNEQMRQLQEHLESTQQSTQKQQISLEAEQRTLNKLLNKATNDLRAMQNERSGLLNSLACLDPNLPVMSPPERESVLTSFQKQAEGSKALISLLSQDLEKFKREAQSSDEARQKSEGLLVVATKRCRRLEQENLSLLQKIQELTDQLNASRQQLDETLQAEQERHRAILSEREAKYKATNRELKNLLCRQENTVPVGVFRDIASLSHVGSKFLREQLDVRKAVSQARSLPPPKPQRFVPGTFPPVFRQQQERPTQTTTTTKPQSGLRLEAMAVKDSAPVMDQRSALAALSESLHTRPPKTSPTTDNTSKQIQHESTKDPTGDPQMVVSRSVLENQRQRGVKKKAPNPEPIVKRPVLRERPMEPNPSSEDWRTTKRNLQSNTEVKSRTKQLESALLANKRKTVKPKVSFAPEVNHDVLAATVPTKRALFRPISIETGKENGNQPAAADSDVQLPFPIKTGVFLSPRARRKVSPRAMSTKSKTPSRVQFSFSPPRSTGRSNVRVSKVRAAGGLRGLQDEIRRKRSSIGSQKRNQEHFRKRLAEFNIQPVPLRN